MQGLCRRAIISSHQVVRALSTTTFTNQSDEDTGRNQQPTLGGRGQITAKRDDDKQNQHNHQDSSKSFSQLSGAINFEQVRQRTTDGYTWPNLYDEAHEMMMASFISYPITFLLREARAGRLKNSEAILEQFKATNDNNVSISLGPQDFIDIVRDNMDYIATNYPLGSPEFGWYSVFEMYNKLNNLAPNHDDIQLIEFDDKQETHRLVYGIGINKRLKRITVIFRGTYAQDTRDWVRNLQFGLVDVPLPSVVLEDDDDPITTTTTTTTNPSSTATSTTNYNNNDKNNNNKLTQLFVHQGIYEYLFHNSERGLDYPRERYEEILGNILSCLDQVEYHNYKVFVTGHSLGGALALLLAFFAAAEERLPKPVTCVSLGSLLVGDAAFQQAFERLERKGWIRHLRITNQHDPVPCLPPFTWYKPVGMHLRLLADQTTTDNNGSGDNNKYSMNNNLNGHQQGSMVGYQLEHATRTNDASISAGVPPINTFSALWESYQAAGSLEQLQAPHFIPEYLRRLEREKSRLQSLSLNECYRNPDYVGPNFSTRL
ncbi:hypothetical protein ACA910_017954 [Epithemia clementina (nom. ined.)]